MQDIDSKLIKRTKEEKEEKEEKFKILTPNE
jgi:hypothetical protein